MEIKLNHKFIILALILSLFFLFLGYITYNNSLSDRFSDEVAHMVGGHFVTQGKELYKDLQFNHQPLNYYYSAFIEYISSPDNLYLYISRQRLGMYLYGLVWNIIYFLIFGPFMLLFSFIFEIGKYWFSGHKLLGESLATYPLIFMIGVLIETFFFKKQISKLKLILVSISSFIAGFSLLPLWILIGPINLIIFFFQKNKNQAFVLLVIPILILTGIMCLFLNPFNLYKETVSYNMNYFVPETEVFRPKLWQVLLFPFFTFTFPLTTTKIVTAILVLIFFINGYLSYRSKKLMKWIVLLILFIGTNFFRVNETAFSSFHLLPWFGTLLMIDIFFMHYFFNIKDKIAKNISLSIFFIFCTLFIFILFKESHLWKKKNLAIEFENQYSYSETYGRAIKILKDHNDKLVVAPNDPLVYWVSEVDMPIRMMEFVPWAYPIPEYNKEIRTVFKNDPPEFVIDANLDLRQDLEKYILTTLNEKYIRIDHLGNPSRLYILKEKLPEISASQWQELEGMLFTKP